MRKLEFRFDCLDGQYVFDCEADQVLTYQIETDIEGLSSFSGDLDEEKTAAFFAELELSKLKSWEREYRGENLIEDSTHWSVRYFAEDKEYVSEGYESFEPYNYEHLIRALMICDEKAEYFLI